MEKLLEEIEVALLAGQKRMVYNQILIDLRPLKRDTYKRKKIEAKQRAIELAEVILS